MDAIELKTIVASLVKTAKQNLETKGQLLPIAALITDKRVAIGGLVFGNSVEEKRAIYRQVDKMAKQMGADAIVLVNDTWYITREPNANLRGVAPSDEPDRKEALCVTVESKLYRQSLMFPYHRDGSTIVWDEPVAPTDEFESFITGDWTDA